MKRFFIVSSILAFLAVTHAEASYIAGTGAPEGTAVKSTGENANKVLTAQGNGTSLWADVTGAGLGDVSGPGSSTDNGFCRFDSTTGKVIQDTGTGASLSDAGIGTFANILDSGLTASKPVFTDGSKNLVSTGTLAADQGGTGVANNVAATLTRSGNHALTITTTGTTGVTLPTTGTLVNTAGNVATATALAADPADCAGGMFSNAINASGTLSCVNPFTGFVETWGGQIKTAENTTYYPIPSAPVAMQVESFTAFCTSGSITGKLQIASADGSSPTDITSCTGVSVGTTQGTVTTCDTGSSNNLAALKKVLFVTTSNSTCLDLVVSVKTTRD